MSFTQISLVSTHVPASDMGSLRRRDVLECAALHEAYVGEVRFSCTFANMFDCARHTSRSVHKVFGLIESNRQTLGHSLLVLLLAYVAQQYYPRHYRLMISEEAFKEFWDPDTVALMHWIEGTTPRDASFAGSMQLLAGVFEDE